MNGQDPQPILEMRNVSKSFGPVSVIKDVSVAVQPGKVQALLGENGAGKSTIIKMMAGVHRPDSGEIIVDGAPVTFASTKEAEAKGIATIYQELNLVPTLSVAENIMLGRTPNSGGLVNFRQLTAEAQEALDFIGLKVDLDTPVSELGLARQQLVEIAKALSMKARVLILDEPTAALTGKEIDQLFTVIDDLKQRGVGMVFISHHLDEIARIADSVSVLRDGEFIAEVPADTSEDEFVRLMVGRDIEDQYPRIADTPGKPVLEVADLSSEGKFDDITFTVHTGEVVGIAGLVGAGRTEVIRAIAGADHYDSGTVRVNGKELPNGNVSAAISEGVGHVPEDRKNQGLILDASVGDNIGLATLHSSATAGLADRSGQRKRANEVAEQLRVRMSGIDQHVRNLSGGNQQKAVFGRWVMADSQVLLLDEPTRGVDVGAKVEIYNIINDITANGGAVLMASSDLPEVLGMSDRILVMSGGHIAGELPPTATQDEVMKLAVSQVEDAVDEYPPSTEHSEKE
ncbi:sugar ABC transporter ATP-binding protein [Corynebacterium cystitidis]|uniref:Monosaccharide ABC transporter ATP-binding protein, CUT2 family (TC 3.A.1.2.-) n=1 Tax=Corynebacterium cystitidis DSM 20524 TaxID=1121357 RepID=A0A1H9QJK3_9CORY|nr:sugar ABC transporter ATP-binding protein [Corynebacterium cystitidis]WJY81753.1 Galactose/methyl galactoside import ATP-binding protein MglA [Corynebacterium cystitidis DSM 20524]SER60642.1 monosaccharide ABC transporter ATP-binding protein, CUT2 family (TC 3.A.1.2.-) [Corynebacterium cystitidis DSM 20524]SNV84013.1 ABC-type sugar (aldose) transport system, ATPase component [Corynebacterium cystitidis]